tara:strand:+ start:198 stop:983 length:786 start_codon:yes stop_codon:yes gene_type:complete
MKNKDSDDFDLTNLAQFIYNVYKRRKRLVLVLLVVTILVGIYDMVTTSKTTTSFYLIKCNETFFQHKDNDVKQIGLELCYNLSNYVTHENYAGLSKLINVDQKTVKSIDNMKVINLNKNENDHFFRIYLYFKNQINSYGIVDGMVNYMNQVPLLIKQKKLNEQYYNQYLEDLNKKINDFTNDSTKSNTEKNTLYKLIKQKNELTINSQLNTPFYITNPENNITSSNNYMLTFLKYLFSFLFISSTMILILEGIGFIKKYSS